jgi:hypothetical protein
MQQFAASVCTSCLTLVRLLKVKMGAVEKCLRKHKVPPNHVKIEFRGRPWEPSRRTFFSNCSLQMFKALKSEWLHSRKKQEHAFSPVVIMTQLGFTKLLKLKFNFDTM